MSIARDTAVIIVHIIIMEGTAERILYCYCLCKSFDVCHIVSYLFYCFYLVFMKDFSFFVYLHLRATRLVIPPCTAMLASVGATPKARTCVAKARDAASTPPRQPGAPPALAIGD